jgi:hypothetical protein
MPLTNEVFRRFPLQIPTQLPLWQLYSSPQDKRWVGTWGRLIVFQSDHTLEISVFQKLKLNALLFNE